MGHRNEEVSCLRCYRSVVWTAATLTGHLVGSDGCIVDKSLHVVFQARLGNENKNGLK